MNESYKMATDAAVNFLSGLWGWLIEGQNAIALTALIALATFIIYLIISFWRKKSQQVVQNYGITLKEHEASLRRHEKEIYARIAKGGGAKTDESKLLENELAGVQAQLQDLNKSFEEEQARRLSAEKGLEKFRQELPAAKIRQLKKQLAESPDTREAETAFDDLIAKNAPGLAEAYFQSGNLAFGRIDYPKTYERLTQAARLNPQNAEYLQAAGDICRTIAHYEEGEPYLLSALEIQEKTAGKNHPKVGTTLNNLAELYRAQGKYEAAMLLYPRALSIMKKAFPDGHPYIDVLESNIAEMEKERNNPRKKAE